MANKMVSPRQAHQIHRQIDKLLVSYTDMLATFHLLKRSIDKRIERHGHLFEDDLAMIRVTLIEMRQRMVAEAQQDIDNLTAQQEAQHEQDTSSHH